MSLKSASSWGHPWAEHPRRHPRPTHPGWGHHRPQPCPHPGWGYHCPHPCPPPSLGWGCHRPHPCQPTLAPSPYPQVGGEVVAQGGCPRSQIQHPVPGRLVVLQQQDPPGQLGLQPVQLQLRLKAWHGTVGGGGHGSSATPDDTGGAPCPPPARHRHSRIFWGMLWPVTLTHSTTGKLRGGQHPGVLRDLPPSPGQCPHTGDAPIAAFPWQCPHHVAHQLTWVLEPGRTHARSSGFSPSGTLSWVWATTTGCPLGHGDSAEVPGDPGKDPPGHAATGAGGTGTHRYTATLDAP